MAALFLGSGMSLTVSRMSCLKSGKTRYAFHQLKDCCKKETNGRTAVQDNCCDIKTSQLFLANFQSSQKGQLKTFSFSSLQTPFSYKIDLAYCNSEIKKEGIPPPLHGRQLLSFISVLII